MLFSALSAKWLAQDLGKNCRFWFWLSLLVPVVPCIILLCIPEGEKPPRPVDNDELYDYLY